MALLRHLCAKNRMALSHSLPERNARVMHLDLFACQSVCQSGHIANSKTIAPTDLTCSWLGPLVLESGSGINKVFKYSRIGK